MDATATAKLALDASGMDRGLTQAQASLQKFARTAANTIASGFAFNKIISGFTTAIEKGDQLQDIAEKFGVSASKLQMLGNAASVFGSGVDQVSAGLNKLSLAQQKALAGDVGLANTFQEVGISLEDLKGMAPEDVLLKISDSFSSGANEGRQFIIVNELLGKAQTDLIKLLNQGSEAIAAQGEALGVLSDEEIASLSELSDQFKQLQSTISNTFGTLASFINPAIKAFQDFAEEVTLLVSATGALFKGDFALAGDLAKMGAPGAASRRRAAEGKPQTKPIEAQPLISPEEQARLIEEKKKQDKALFDEELYDLQEEARMEADRDKTLFDRLMRDAEFARDEKKRILEIEKENAQKARDLIMRGMEASGTILDKVRGAAERLGLGGLVRQIDVQRARQLRQTDVSLVEGIGESVRRPSRSSEAIAALTQTEGELQRAQNTELLNSFKDMQKLVADIYRLTGEKLGVPILRSAN
jgi:hypothetical protein